MKAKLTKIGNSLWVLVPKYILKKLKKKEEDEIEISFNSEDQLDEIESRLEKLEYQIEKLSGGNY